MNDAEALKVVVGIGSVIGALAGLGLSFTSLSPLVIGGIVGVMSIMLGIICTAISIISAYKANEKTAERWKNLFKDLTTFVVEVVTSTVTGSALGAVSGLFLSTPLVWWQVAIAGTLIGCAATVATILSTELAGSLIEKEFKHSSSQEEKKQSGLLNEVTVNAANATPNR